MSEPTSDSTARWADTWRADEANGSLTMSQRKLSAIEERPGGLATVRTVAEQHGVHLAVFVDDRGQELVVASTHPIRVIC
ncbi:MAG: hypothetical protein M3154_08180 [Candidatus Eremiobacteraeota bacterium]|nr:hypothetical protein [Candidatus Eremiobacteraeota bacterium]